jgi:hypothetical protein
LKQPLPHAAPQASVKHPLPSFDSELVFFGDVEFLSEPDFIPPT